MTICIAAITPNQEIVAVSDQMLSMAGGMFANDAATLKELPIHPDWLLMFAADDVGVVPRLVRKIMDAVRDHVGGDFSKSIDDLALSAMLTESFQAERLERAEELYLSPNGVSLAEFHKNGSKIFGATGAAILRERIEQHRLGCELLVAGHSPKIATGARVGHLFHVSDPGVVKDYDQPRYWAIGTGSYSALSALAMRGHNVLRLLPETIYNVCEAKFVAESAFGVGRQTFLTIRDKDRRWSDNPAALVEQMRAQWELVGRPRPSHDAVKLAATWLKETSWVSPFTIRTKPDGPRDE